MSPIKVETSEKKRREKDNSKRGEAYDQLDVG